MIKITQSRDLADLTHLYNTAPLKLGPVREPDARCSRLAARMNDVSSDDGNSEQIRAFYRALFSAWGRLHWWPAQSRFEVIVGAYLTQNTSWSNVEKAIRNLRQTRSLNIAAIRQMPLGRLEKLIRSAGYFRQKARRLKAFIQFLDERYAGSLTRMFAQPTTQLREELLALNGIGPETADSILLYAGNHPVFVVDAYTRRILERHEIISPRTNYEEIRELCEGALASTADELGDNSQPLEILTKPRGTHHRPSRMSTARRTELVQIFNEMHGLIVGVGKNHCQKSQMRCEQCPLQKFLPGKC